VQGKQKQPAESWWLISQPDHAALAGDLARHIEAPGLPTLSPEILEAITLHDAGWVRFDGGARGTANDLEISLPDPMLDARGRPLSFLDMAPVEFLLAWHGSIEDASDTGPTGGLIVSEHFCRIARTRLDSRIDSADDINRLEEFLRGESARHANLIRNTRYMAAEIFSFVEVLQFCDLLSLYLCCGATEPVEFPQRFGGKVVQARVKDHAFLIEPRLFTSGLSLGVTARSYSMHDCVALEVLSFQAG